MSIDVITILRQAVACCQTAKFDEAEALLRSVVKHDPHQSDGWHLLGLVMYQTGRNELGEKYVRESLRLKPDFADAHFNLGKLLQDAGRRTESIDSYRRCLSLNPDFVDAHYNLANALNEINQPEAAVRSFREAIRRRPDYLKALNNLGKTLVDLEEYEEALVVLQRAVTLQPNYATGLCNLGSALRHLGRLDEAVAACQKAVELKMDCCLANLGAALLEQGRFDEAQAVIRDLIRVKPNDDTQYRNLAVVYWRRGEVAEAMRWNERALETKLDSPQSRFLRAMLWLQQGDFRRGWEEYEWRWKCKEYRSRAPQRPPWDGSPIDGQTLLLHAEQGFGDTLQFIRFAPLVKERARTVMLRCSSRLMPLLSRCRGIDQFVSDGATLPVSDAEAPLMSLPRALKTTLDTIPREVPYLFADPALVERWGRELPRGGFRVGIAWQGNPRFKHDRSRSIPLAQFAPLARLEGVQLISLQKERGLSQIPEVRDKFAVAELGDDFDETSGAFMDTAAVMMNLDLVISSDTAIAHLAGGLGVPVWLATSFMPEWRWLLERDDNPWYPTMKLFRQPKIGDWESVFTRMAEEIKPLAQTAGGKITARQRQ